MPKITWDEAENRIYEYGVSKGVLYVMDDDGTYGEGKAWNGLINVTDSPDGAEVTKLWADNINYAGIVGAEEYHNSIEAYTYPDEFAACEGFVQPVAGMYVNLQTRKKFGLCWRSEIGNANTNELGYKLHVAYGLSATPTEKSRDTVNDSPDAVTFSWDADGTPTTMTGYKPTAKLEFDSTKLTSAQMEAVETLLYGSASAAAKLPTPDELLSAVQGADVGG